MKHMKKDSSLCVYAGDVTIKRDLKENKHVVANYLANIKYDIKIKGDQAFESNICVRFELSW